MSDVENSHGATAPALAEPPVAVVLPENLEAPLLEKKSRTLARWTAGVLFALVVHGGIVFLVLQFQEPTGANAPVEIVLIDFEAAVPAAGSLAIPDEMPTPDLAQLPDTPKEDPQKLFTEQPLQDERTHDKLNDEKPVEQPLPAPPTVETTEQQSPARPEIQLEPAQRTMTEAEVKPDQPLEPQPIPQPEPKLDLTEKRSEVEVTPSVEPTPSVIDKKVETKSEKNPEGTAAHPPPPRPQAKLPPRRQDARPTRAETAQPARSESATPSRSPPSRQAAVAPGNASALAPGNASAIPNWRSQVIGILERNKRYPPDAQARQEHGVAHLAFSLNRQGRLVAAHITGSSGSATLDAETLALVHRVSFPPPPPDVSGAQISLVVSLRYGR